VLVNLITNAIDSNGQRGRVARPVGKIALHEDGDVRVSVADTGTGVDARDINRIFNPLFTTKSDGMGMGLSICRSIIEAHQGGCGSLRTRRAGPYFISAQTPSAST